MRRRNFIAGLASTTVVWPLVARAQQAAKFPVIGYLGGTSAEARGGAVLAAFKNGLAQAGYAEGRNVAIE